MNPEFRKISEIDVENPESWAGKVFLTFDIDWAHDDVLSSVIDIVEHVDVPATWFVTHETKLLERLRKNPKFELGIHPNFNFLLSGQVSSQKTADEVIDFCMDIVPEAVSVRSHSMLQSSVLNALFEKRGLQFECNHFIPYESGIQLSPWKNWNGLVKVPYFWEDDIACSCGDKNNLADLCVGPGLRIFDFHPIHVFLNTEDMKRYECSRAFHRNPEILKNYIFQGDFGARANLDQLLGVR